MSDRALSFWQASRMSWWPSSPKHRIDEVMIGDYDGEGGCGPCGEFGIRWFDHTNGRPPFSPRLEMFHDAWRCLDTPHGKALIAWLVDQHDKRPTPDEVCTFLRAIGCKDTSHTPTPTAATSAPGLSVEK